MRILICFFMVFFLFSKDLNADFYTSHKQYFINEGKKYQGTCTKSFEKINVDFEIYCGQWMNDKKECHYLSKNGKSHIDSTIYKNGRDNPFGKILDGSELDLTNKKSGYYDLIGEIYNDENEKVYSFGYISGYLYSRKIFKLGHLVLEERGCDTAHVFYKKHCLVQKTKRKFKMGSLENFIEYQVDYVWDEQGRLKERTLWNTYDPYGLNGTYNFIYGSPCDSVRVSPIDYYLQGWDSRSEKGKFNGSFGKIPEKGDSEYEAFAENPYDFEASPKLLERQKKRCEDYRKSLKK